MGKVIDLTGQRFGRLTVVEFAGVRNHRAFWMCRCDCGKIACISGHNLCTGHTKSCGCFSRESSQAHVQTLLVAKGATGKTKRPLYGVWHAMMWRCNDRACPSYPRYGGRDIKVCPQWENDYWAFERWAMANGWQEGLTLDRIDNDKGYCPENCRWATPKEQSNNKRNTVFLTFRGQTKSLSSWADTLKICFRTLNSRYRRGWSTEDILTRPVGPQNGKGNKH